MRIVSGLKRKDMGDVPHHGLLILTAGQQMLILGAAVFQSLVCGGTAVQMSARMYCFELIVGIAAILMLYGSIFIERKKETSPPRMGA